MLYCWKVRRTLSRPLCVFFLFADNTCSPSAFTCVHGGQCIPVQWRCDKHNDCIDGSDEQNCPTRAPYSCPSTSFTCDNNMCIPRNWVCDTDNDCLDGSDEKNCGEFWGAFSDLTWLDWIDFEFLIFCFSCQHLYQYSGTCRMLLLKVPTPIKAQHICPTSRWTNKQTNKHTWAGGTQSLCSGGGKRNGFSK